jgi:curved DNA-binding protein CbpA
VAKKKPDLYAELGVPRDAPEAAIRSAYRKRAKETHPDAGGTAEAFALTGTALAVLTDAERRKRYDETGNFEEGAAPDNKRANAIGIIQKFVGDLINPWVTSALDPAKDPRKLDLIAEVRIKIANEIAQARHGVQVGERVVKALEELASRFSAKKPGGDFVRQNILAQAEANRRQVALVKSAIEVNELALELLAGVSFRFDQPDAMTIHTQTQGGFFTFHVG